MARLIPRVGQVEPASRKVGRKLPPPQAGWVTKFQYDPAAGFREEDFNTPSDEYVKRFNARRMFVDTAGSTLVPDVSGVFQVPVQEDGRNWRLRPVSVNSMGELSQLFESSLGRRKRLLESNGNPFDTGDTSVSGGTSPTRLIDQKDFIPLLGGPYWKQLYQPDYLLMHSTAFGMVNHSALASAANKILTRFTIGRGLSFHIKHDKCKEVWDEFWERNDMRNKCRTIARDMSWQGEMMLRYYERRPGYLTMFPMDASECWEVVTNPEFIDEVYFFHCLRGDVQISCLDGTEPTIEDLSKRNISISNPLWVYSYDQASGEVVPGKAVKCWRAGKKKCVEVELDNGQKVVTSHDHPFLKRDGQYVWAETLQPGDSLMPLYRRSGYEEVWHPGRGRWRATHSLVSSCLFGARKDGEVTHHLNHDRQDNRPENLARMPKVVHDAETVRRRWEDPLLADQRAVWVEKARSAVKQAWVNGSYAHLTGKGVRPKSWRKAIAKGVKRAHADPAKRERWHAAVRTGLKRMWADPKKRAKITAAVAVANKRRKNHKVVAVRAVGTYVVYDLQVEKYHNFALTAGVFVHNCQWPAPYQTWVTGRIPVTKYIIQQVPPTNIQHVKLNVSAKEKRGRSDLLPILPWIKRFDDFYDGQTMKAVLEANLVWKLKVLGDQVDIDSIMNDPRLTTLPPPGGVWAENEAVDLQPLSAQLTSSRGSQGIGQQLANIIFAGLNLPGEYANIESGAGSARATALVRTDPAVKTIEDRQQILRELLEDMYDRTCEAALREGRISKSAARHEPEVIASDDVDARPSSSYRRVFLR